MRLVVRRLEVTDNAELQALVADHVDVIEPGLAVLDSRLLLGQATMDLVGLDADGALVLMAVAQLADEEMLLRAVEAYSWCLEYPEAIRRLYPSANISAARPPRLMFVIERMPDAFHRKIKQLGFPEVDCVEFRHLDVEGTPAVYFESLARLRRGPAPAPTPDRVVPGTAPSTGGRPPSARLQKLPGGDRASAMREPAQVVSLVQRSSTRPEAPKPAISTPPPAVDLGLAARVVDEPAVEAVPDPVMASAAIIDVDSIEAAVEAPHVEPLACEPRAAERELPLAAVALVADEPTSNHIAGDVKGTDSSEPVAEALLTFQRVDVDLPAHLEPDVPTAAGIAADVTSTLSTIAPPESLLTPQPEPTLPDDRVEPSQTVATTPESGPTMAATSEAVLSDAVEPMPAVDDVAPTTQFAEPATKPPASVFARRPGEPAATAAEPRVAFANVAKELLSTSTPAPRTEVVAPKPSGAFAKASPTRWPRTIAPSAADPQPVAAGPKHGAQSTPPAPAAGPETTPAPTVEPEPATGPAMPAPPQGFEGLQFPNDGVLTRQWMEFLNQMAAGK